MHNSLPDLPRKFFAYRHIAWVWAAASFVVAIGSLWLGFDMDDFIQRIYLLGSDELAARGLQQAQGNTSFLDAILHYFTFFNPKVENHIQSMKEYGNVPWWFYDSAQLSFFRPLSSFTHWVDFQIFPHRPGLMHFHNLLWGAGLIFVVTKVYQRFLVSIPAWVAGFAGMLYLIDFSRLRPVTWIANRNALLATMFGFLVLLMHDRWRTSKDWRFGLLSAVCFALAVLSAEAGIGVLAFLFAYAVFLDDAPYVKRALSFVPVGMVMVAWRVVYSALGFGAANTRMYIDPIADPLEFMRAVWERAPQLLCGHFIGIENVSTFLSLRATQWLVIGCVVVLLLIFGLFWPILRSDKTARFWALSMVLSVVPVCAYGVPQGRLLSFVAVAGYGLVAQYMLYCFGGERSPYRVSPYFHLTRQFIALVMVFMLVVVQILFWAIANSNVFIGADYKKAHPEENYHSWLRLGTEPELVDKTVVVVNTPDAFSVVYIPFENEYRRLPIPHRIRMLSGNVSPLTVTRLDEYTLLIRPDAGFLPDTSKPVFGLPENVPDIHVGHFMHKVNQGYRDERNPMKVGEQIVLSDLVIEITEVSEIGLPTEVKFTFDRPLEDESFKWLYWNWKPDDTSRSARSGSFLEYRPFKVPAVNESVRLLGPFS